MPVPGDHAVSWCSSVCVERLFREQEAGGSNPLTKTNKRDRTLRVLPLGAIGSAADSESEGWWFESIRGSQSQSNEKYHLTLPLPPLYCDEEDTMAFLDFQGVELNVGDTVIFTAPSYRSLVRGTIVSFTAKKVRVSYRNTWNYGLPGMELEYLAEASFLVRAVQPVKQ